jgi:hypothetical protein
MGQTPFRRDSPFAAASTRAGPSEYCTITRSNHWTSLLWGVGLGLG